MIKKLFLCAALIGAVGLTSCVDDVESASTQAVRQAKAAQLKAKGDLEKAQADAKLIFANAEQQAAETELAAKQAQAELDKAEAAYQLALAAYKEAQAAEILADSEIAKQEAAVKLEEAKVTLENTQINLQLAQIELQRKQAELTLLIAQYEKEIAESERWTEYYKQELQKELDKLEGHEYTKLQTLVTNYNSAYFELTELRKSLNEYKLNLAKYEAGNFGENNAATLAQANIDEANKNINKYNKAIKNAEAVIEALQTPEIQEAVAKVEALKVDQVVLNQAKNEAVQSALEANIANVDALVALNNSDYQKAILETQSAGSYSDYRVSNNFDNDMPAELKGKWYVVYEELNASETARVKKYIPLFTEGIQTTEVYQVTYTNYSWTATSDSYEYPIYNNPYFKPVGDGCEAYSKLLDAKLSGLEKDMKTATQNLEKSVAKQTVLNTTWANYKTAASKNFGLKKDDPNAPALQKAYQEALDTLKGALKAIGTPYEMGALSEPPYGKGADGKMWYDAERFYTPAIAQIDRIVINQTDIKNQKENSFNSGKETIAAIQANLSVITSANYTEYNKLVVAANEASKGKAVADCNKEVANGKYNTNQQLIYAYNVTINEDGLTAGSVKTEIENQNKLIARNEALIKEQETLIEKYNKDLEAGNLDNDKVVAQTKAEIEKLEAQIAAQQKVVDAAKAALDAALAEDAPAEK